VRGFDVQDGIKSSHVVLYKTAIAVGNRDHTSESVMSLPDPLNDEKVGYPARESDEARAAIKKVFTVFDRDSNSVSIVPGYELGQRINQYRAIPEVGFEHRRRQRKLVARALDQFQKGGREFLARARMAVARVRWVKIAILDHRLRSRVCEYPCLELNFWGWSDKL